MGKYTSYYLYQKFEKRGEQGWVPAYPNEWDVNGDGTMPLSAKTENDPACGYVPSVDPIYDWAVKNSSEYICDNYNKYEKLYERVSYDNGVTYEWVVPYQTMKGSLIEANSVNCGYIPMVETKWTARYPSGVVTAACDSSSAITQGEITLDDLMSVEIGDCVTLLGSPNNVVNRPFENAISLTSVTFGQNVNRIGNGSFYNCSGLTSISIPDSVTYIGYSAFVNCKSLTSVTIPDSVTTIGDSAFQNCFSLTSVNIPSGITRIQGYTFDSCRSLTSVTIPSSVTRIEWSAFQGCNSLQSITFLSKTPPVLSGCCWFPYNDCPIYVPCESIGEYASAQGWGQYADRLKCADVVPSTKWIGYDISGRATTRECSTASTSIRQWEVFGNTDMDKLKSVIIGDCVTSIGNEAFGNDSIFSTGPYTALTYVRLPETVTSINTMAFNGCTALSFINLPNSLTTIGASAFRNCSGLTSVSIPSGVTRINDNAFSRCSGLTSVSIPSGVTYIGDGAFDDCTSLTQISIPNTVWYIGVSSFRGCNNAMSVIIGSGVTTIESSAFEGCSNLDYIEIRATTPPELHENAFYNTNNCDILVPHNSFIAYANAYGWRDYRDRLIGI